MPGLNPTPEELEATRGMPEPVAAGFILARRKAQGQPKSWDDLAQDGQGLLNLLFGPDFGKE